MKNHDQMNVILTGFMGTGKTSVGRTLAIRLGYEFVDTDQLIEAKIGMTIADFFQKMGEPAFRKIESDLARELAHQSGLVISTGGRLMLDADNAATLGRTGRVFCLVATPEEILQRIENDQTVRPLLQGGNPLEKIVELLQERKIGYGRFPQLVTSGKTVERIAEEIAVALAGES